MLTVRHARFEPSPISPQHLRAGSPVYGLLLWAVALLCIASLGQAFLSLPGGGDVDVATLPAGLI